MVEKGTDIQNLPVDLKISLIATHGPVLFEVLLYHESFGFSKKLDMQKSLSYQKRQIFYFFSVSVFSFESIICWRMRSPYYFRFFSRDTWPFSCCKQVFYGKHDKCKLQYSKQYHFRHGNSLIISTLKTFSRRLL